MPGTAEELDIEPWGRDPYRDRVTDSGGERDVLIRISRAEHSGLIDVSMIPTQQLTHAFMVWRQLHDRMVGWLRNIWHEHKYLEEYTTYLQGGFSDEEFKEIADRFARPYAILGGSELRESIRQLRELLEEQLSADQVGKLLNVEPSNIDALVPQLDSGEDGSELTSEVD